MLGRDRPLELFRPALPRGDPSDDPLARPLLLRVVLQPAPPEDPAALLAPRQPLALRPGRLDDVRRGPLGDPAVPRGDPSQAPAPLRDRAPPLLRGPPDVRGRARWKR